MLISQLTLQTSNVKATKSFYSGILEFPLIAETGNLVSFSIGHTVLTFIETKITKPTYHFAFSIPSNKIAEAQAYIASKTNILPFNANTTVADYKNWNAHAFYFHDNQQNILECIAHHDLPTDTNEPFTASSIIGICEIGIPVNDVAEECERINKEYKVPYFKKGPRSEDFAVMGDDKGLFIITSLQRGWIPTQAPAERHVTEVVFTENTEEFKLVIEA